MELVSVPSVDVWGVSVTIPVVVELGVTHVNGVVVPVDGVGVVSQYSGVVVLTEVVPSEVKVPSVVV